MSDDLRASVLAAGEGDEQALQHLMAELLPGLKGFLYRRADDLTLKQETTDDLAQSVCREVLERLADGRFEFRGDAAFKQWMYEAALWKLRARARFYRAERRDVRRARGQRDTEASEAPPVSETPSRIALAAEQEAQVTAAMERLPARDAEILRLAVLEQRPHREIARKLGIQESHSRVLLSRALAKMAGTLGPEA